jgi:hypothetical protein
VIKNIFGTLNQLYYQGVLNSLVWLGGNLVYVDGLNGSDSAFGGIDSPVQTLEHAYSLLRSGMNDAVVIKGNPLTDSASSCTVRLNAAFDWNKPATHLVGLNPSFSNNPLSPRARIAPSSTATAFANFFTVSATGCMFFGIEFFQSFAADGNNQIAVTVSGARNYFKNCHFAGISKGSDTGGRSLVLTSPVSGNAGENLFEDCVIGLDTISRSVANAQLGLIGAQVPRNYFRECIFNSWATAAGALMISAGAAAIDRFVYFESCKFFNFGTGLTSLMSIGASQNGTLIFSNPVRVNCGNYGDTANTLIFGPLGNNTTGLGIAPSA